MIDAARRREPALSWLTEVLRQPGQVGVCAITVAEFFTGLRPDERPRWAAVFDELVYWDLTCDIARRAGAYRYDYARRGRAIQTTDALIAATAATVGAAIVTDNVKDFPMPDVEIIQILR